MLTPTPCESSHVDPILLKMSLSTSQGGRGGVKRIEDDSLPEKKGTY